MDNKKINEVFTEEVCKEIQTAKEDYENTSKDVEKEFYRIMKERILFQINKHKGKRKITVKVPTKIDGVDVKSIWRCNLIEFLCEDMKLRVSIRLDSRWEITFD